MAADEKSGYISSPVAAEKITSKRSRPLFVEGRYVGGKYALTGPEFEQKMTERQAEINNLIRLRWEYNRYVRPRGWKSSLNNPLIPFGLGTIVFSLIYSMIKAKDTQVTARMLGWRVHAQFFTVVAFIFGLGMHRFEESRWVTEQAIERNWAINKVDLSRSAFMLRKHLEENS